MQLRKFLVRALGGTVVLLAATLAIALSQSRIELTEHAVHKRLLVPVPPAANIGLHLYGGTGDHRAIPGFLDGPVVRRHTGGKWSATWFCENRAERKQGTDAELVIECAGKRSVYPLAMAAIPPAVFPAPEKLALLSDIEGNRGFLDASLLKLGVVDADGNWNYGSNHLVIAGDSVDRGRDVFAVLWRLHSLSQQAQLSGGAVHVLLGNHEQYILRGNLSRANKEHLYALEQMGGHGSALAADTVLGEWLRAHPVVLKAGTVLLTHGGIGPQVAKAGLSVDTLNDAMRRYWRGETARSAALDAVLGPDGVTQYRGYFEAGDERYAKASKEDVEAVLRHFGATTIVVGHTLVDRVTSLHGGLVYGVDVNTNSAVPEVLVFQQGKPHIVNTGVRRNLSEGSEAVFTRPFELGSARDWAAVGSLVSSSYRLARLPYPY